MQQSSNHLEPQIYFLTQVTYVTEGPVLPASLSEYKGMKAPIGWQEVALLWDLLDLSRSWGSLDGSLGQSSISGYSTNIGLVGVTLDIPKDRLES